MHDAGATFATRLISRSHTDPDVWALMFECYGARLGVRADKPELVADMVPLLPPHAETRSQLDVDQWFELRRIAQDRWRLSVEGAPESSELSRTDTLRRLQSMLHDSVAQHARGFLFVHAGAVAWDGHTVILPGRSMSGKTTAVAALVAAGAKYLSDEFAVLSRDGRVHPYAKPLSVRGQDGQITLATPEDLGGQTAEDAQPAAAVVHARFEQGSQGQPERMTPAQTLLALLDNTVVVRSAAELSMELLSEVARSAVGYAGVRGDAQQFVDALQEDIESLSIA